MNRESFDDMAKRIRREVHDDEVDEGIVPPSVGDCIACDGYVLTSEELPYCPTCARLRREAEANQQDGI